MQYICDYLSPLGNITVACCANGVSGVWFEGQKHFGKTLSIYEKKKLPLHDKVFAWLDQYFEGMRPDLNLPLAPIGTEFQCKVWNELLKIPYGSTVTYGEMAKRIGCRCAQAVGNAVARNPISIIIPCHRVLGSNGSLTGYAGGIDRKKQLLESENKKMKDQG